ncbi:hypothetical protein BT67DRAFT_255860 [Trichocladium antarcticum]|uniref:Uncharacterized protein n=1 Tax=Trichocladium antarcticum TaxID=1450529 RepID=A0AAN6UM65_9PEZI|nr:hypothetical protein BT67DRAFT_255860 [Trichocladium antarcticum]
MEQYSPVTSAGPCARIACGVESCRLEMGGPVRPKWPSDQEMGADNQGSWPLSHGRVHAAEDAGDQSREGGSILLAPPA